MKGVKQPLGYTIIEVMIVLAISGLMFLIAANFISGKEESTAFTEGTNEFVTDMQSVIDQVSDGQYSDISFNCFSGVGGTLTFPGAGTQGTNPACVFLGKFLYFTQGTNADNYLTFSLAGNRLDSATGDSATTLAEINPTPIDQGSVNLTTRATIPQQLDVKSMQVTVGASTNAAYGIGFIQSAGTVDPVTGQLDNGAQMVSLVYSPTLNAPNLPENSAVTDITGNVAFANSAVMCITDGTKTAEITFGDSSDGADQLSVGLVVTPC